MCCVRLTEQSLQPMYTQLNDLDSAIKEQLLKINSLKANILKNEETIQAMMAMVVIAK